MKIAINNLQDEVEEIERIQEIINKVLRIGQQELEVDEKVEISIALVDDAYIQQLNAEFRDREESTDVLSFPQDENQLLGDVIISLETAAEQAREYGHELAREVGFLTIHGLLHLLGYNHKQEAEREVMRQKEEEILAKAGLER